jgi:hypothetical protein
MFILLNINHAISQAIKYIRLKHYKIKFHIPQFYNCDKININFIAKFKFSFSIKYP